MSRLQSEFLLFLAGLPCFLRLFPLVFVDLFEFFMCRCRQLDSGDHLVEYYLGLHAAFRSQIPLAVSHVKNALNLFPEHLPSLHLMILLLTAQKQMKEASELLDSALQDYPDNIWLHFLKIHLELHLQNTEVNKTEIQSYFVIGNIRLQKGREQSFMFYNQIILRF